MNVPMSEVADRLALRDLIDAYATAVDARDGEAFAALFREDAALRIFEAGAAEPAIEYRGTAELRTVPDLLDKLKFGTTFHLMANHRCQIDGDRATGETYCLAHHLRERDGALQDVVMVIRYRDTYARGEDGWRFAQRDVLRQWTEIRPAELAQLAPATN
jgi:hypothetical protein